MAGPLASLAFFPTKLACCSLTGKGKQAPPWGQSLCQESLPVPPTPRPNQCSRARAEGTTDTVCMEQSQVFCPSFKIPVKEHYSRQGEVILNSTLILRGAGPLPPPPTPGQPQACLARPARPGGRTHSTTGAQPMSHLPCAFERGSSQEWLQELSEQALKGRGSWAA